MSSSDMVQVGVQDVFRVYGGSFMLLFSEFSLRLREEKQGLDS